MDDFAIYGACIGAVGQIVANLMNGQVPGLLGLIPPAIGGAVLGAMVYVFYAGTR